MKDERAPGPPLPPGEGRGEGSRGVSPTGCLVPHPLRRDNVPIIILLEGLGKRLLGTMPNNEGLMEPISSLAVGYASGKLTELMELTVRSCVIERWGRHRARQFSKRSARPLSIQIRQKMSLNARLTASSATTGAPRSCLTLTAPYVSPSLNRSGHA